LATLTDHVDLLNDRAGGLLGESLERRYPERASAYFGRVRRRTRVLDVLTIEEALEERLSPDEMRDGLLTDIIVSGKPRTRPDVAEVWLAVEVSSVVDQVDVRRIVRRRRLLTRSGRPVVPVVAGQAITTSADAAARSEQVAVVEDGRFTHWTKRSRPRSAPPEAAFPAHEPAYEATERADRRRAARSARQAPALGLLSEEDRD